MTRMYGKWQLSWVYFAIQKWRRFSIAGIKGSTLKPFDILSGVYGVD